MKMSKEAFEMLKDEVGAIIRENPDCVYHYENGMFHMADKVRDLQKRFMWDLFHAARMRAERYGRSEKLNQLLFDLNDAHIETALKKIVPTITRRYALPVEGGYTYWRIKNAAGSTVILTGGRFYVREAVRKMLGIIGKYTATPIDNYNGEPDFFYPIPLPKSKAKKCPPITEHGGILLNKI